MTTCSATLTTFEPAKGIRSCEAALCTPHVTPRLGFGVQQKARPAEHACFNLRDTAVLQVQHVCQSKT